MTAMTSFPKERELMREAERKIGCALKAGTPGLATSNILSDYLNLPDEGARIAFVCVLATRLAVKEIVSSALP
jgi:hypothetical protein